jgi:predicted RNA-binding protein with PUA-like domain
MEYERNVKDEMTFGEARFVYCKSHMRPHLTGWCTVPASQKTLLTALALNTAIVECRALGLKIYND